MRVQGGSQFSSNIGVDPQNFIARTSIDNRAVAHDSQKTNPREGAKHSAGRGSLVIFDHEELQSVTQVRRSVSLLRRQQYCLLA